MDNGARLRSVCGTRRHRTGLKNAGVYNSFGTVIERMSFLSCSGCSAHVTLMFLTQLSRLGAVHAAAPSMGLRYPSHESQAALVYSLPSVRAGPYIFCYLKR